jgi:hypothetical protein
LGAFFADNIGSNSIHKPPAQAVTIEKVPPLPEAQMIELNLQIA